MGERVHAKCADQPNTLKGNPMNISKDEKDRRSAKKMYEQFDERLSNIFQDKEFTDEVIKEWAKADPKGFMQLFGTRLPKVQPVDQDLQKTFISLKSMLLDLPEVEDIAKALKKAQAESRKYKLESEQKDQMINLLKEKLEKARAQNV